MQTTRLKFDSIKQASAALNVGEDVLAAARSAGCLAFVHGRIEADLLAPFFAKNTRAINAALAEKYQWGEPVRLAPGLAKRLARRVAELTAELQAQPHKKRFVGREIAGRVKAELNEDLAHRLAGMSPMAAAIEVARLRERILGGN